MGSRFYSVVIDARDPAALGRFWGQVLDWPVVYEAPDEVAIEKDGSGVPALVFVPVPEAKAGKNRVHIDLNPDDQDAEVQRLIELGATRVDVGQGPERTDEVTWVVLADPEGNEFCVLTAREQ